MRFSGASRLGNLRFYCFQCCLLLGIVGTLTLQCANGKTLHFVAHPTPAITHANPEKGRLNRVVMRVFELTNTQVHTHVSRRAFAESGLISGEFDGKFDHLSIDTTDDKFLYSDGYLPFELYVVSKSHDVSELSSFEALADERVGILSYYAMNPIVRSHGEVKWSRTPTLKDLIRLLGDERVPYVLLDAVSIQELNGMLSNIGKPVLKVSPEPLISGHYQLSINRTMEHAHTIIEHFNEGIQSITTNNKMIALVGIPFSLGHISTNNGNITEYQLNPTVFKSTLKSW